MISEYLPIFKPSGVTGSNSQWFVLTPQLNISPVFVFVKLGTYNNLGRGEDLVIYKDQVPDDNLANIWIFTNPSRIL